MTQVQAADSTRAVASRGNGAPAKLAWRPAALQRSGLAGWVLGNLVAAALYCTLGWAVSQFFAVYGLFPSPIWLPSSIAVVAAMIGGLRMLPGLFLGSLIANYALFDPPLYEACLISLTNALGPIAGVAAMRRLRPEAGLFSRLRGVVAFVVCAVALHAAITATGGSFALWVSEGLPFEVLPAIWVKWWLSDSGGTLFFAPAMVLWLGMEKETLPRSADVDRADLMIWTGVGAAAVVVFATLPLDGPVRWTFPFLLVIPLSWVALQISLRAASTLVSLVAVVASAAAVVGVGPLSDEALDNPMQLVGVLVVLLALTVLTIVALVTERREAEESSRFKSMFLASASHDLRTPLNAIIGFSEMMRNEVLGPVGTPRYREYVEHINSSGKVLLEIVDDILDLSKIEAGRREIAPVALDAAVVARACRDLVAHDAEKRGVALELEIGEDVTLFADEVALREIVLNLLSNAIAFTPRDGLVRFILDRAPGGGTSITVADTGIGMDEDGLELALQPFGQVAAAAGPERHGTGLGLPIAVRLAELHGGSLTIESRPGAGTTVRVILPPAP